MPRSQGPDLVSLLPGCGPSLGFPLRQMRTQPLVGAAGRAGLGGRSHGALAGLPGPARGGTSRPFHPAAPGGATGPKGCRRDSSPHARPGEEETPTSAPLGARAEARAVRTAGGATRPRLGLPGGSLSSRGAARSGRARASGPISGRVPAPPPSGRRATEILAGVWGASVAPRPTEAEARMDARAADPPTLGRPDPLLSRYTVPPQGLGDEGSRNAGLCPPGFPAACTPLCVTAELGVTLCGSTACGCGPGGEQARDRAVSECAGFPADASFVSARPPCGPGGVSSGVSSGSQAEG